MPKVKVILMCMATGTLAVIAGFAFSAPEQMSAQRESEVMRLLSEPEFHMFQVAWIVLALLATGSALLLGYKLGRLLRSRNTHP